MQVFKFATIATVLSILNVVGDVNTSGLSVFTMNYNIDNLNATSTTLLTYINNLTNPSIWNVKI